MKTHVTIDGVTLTRAQVETAHKALNEPEAPTFKVGDLVTAYGHRGIVVQVGPDDNITRTSYTLAAVLNRAYGPLESGDIRIVTNRGCSWSGRANAAVLLSELKR